MTEFKKLTEVIQSLEVCNSGSESCKGCYYHPSGCKRALDSDVLHYLKEYQVKEVPKIRDKTASCSSNQNGENP